MEPLTLLTWAGVIGLSIIIAAIAIYTVFVIVQNMRGKTRTKVESGTFNIITGQRDGRP